MSLTLADLLAEHWASFAQAHPHALCSAHYRAVCRVLSCRTAALGGRLYRCGDCREKHFAYHSCNHRSCPQCGALDQQVWSAKQEARLLPVPYFMVTFTIPAELRRVCQRHPRELYDLMLKQSAAALKDVVHTRTKGTIGFTSVLHTWGRQLQHHPHIHSIVPAAAFRPDSGTLHQPNNNGFLVHFRPLAQRFRNLMRVGLKQVHPEIYRGLSKEQKHSLSQSKPWNVQLQQVGKGRPALRYLARYVKRSGFTNKRLLGYHPDGKHVLLSWTSNATGKRAVLKISIHEFIRRWLLHVLPKGLARVRHYGYLSSAAKKTRLYIRALLGQLGEPEPKLPELTPFCCPRCQGKLQFLRELARLNPHRGPPASANRKQLTHKAS